MDAPDETRIHIFPAQFPGAFPDHELIVIPEPGILGPETVQDLFRTFFIIPVPVLRHDQEHMPVADLEQRGPPVIGFRRMPDQGAEFVGHCLSAFIQFPDIQAQEQEVLSLFVAVTDQVVQSAQVVRAERCVIRVGMNQVHDGDHRKQECGNRIGGLEQEPRRGQQHDADCHHAEKAVHYTAVQPTAHPQEHDSEQGGKQDIPDRKDQGTFKGERSVHYTETRTREDPDGIRR